jgi:hypothetical protein
MKATDLLRFVLEEAINYDWHNDDVIMFLPIYQIEDFQKVLNCEGIYDDYGIECHMKSGYLAIEMKCVVEYFGFDLEDIFKK